MSVILIFKLKNVLAMQVQNNVKTYHKVKIGRKIWKSFKNSHNKVRQKICFFKTFVASL